MGILWFILILGAIVLVHEFGHFILKRKMERRNIALD